jgi:DNA gyrase/topoisomerase IV subunit B
MVEADQSYHPQIVRAIIAVALWEAREEIKRNIQREGRIKLHKVPHREIEMLAKAMVMERRDEFLAKARASSVVQDEIKRLQTKEQRKRQRQLERNSKHLSNSERCGSQELPLDECHAQNGDTK